MGSFLTASHLRDTLSDEWLAHGVSMSVMVDARTRKPCNVIPAVRKLCDEHWKTLYPNELKRKYKELKGTLRTEMHLLNALKSDVRKQRVSGCTMRLRFADEDLNRHLNVNA